MIQKIVKKSMHNKKLNNKGYTLVELIVAMLIGAIVMLAAAGFVSLGSNLFRNGTSDVNLSVESETALNFVSDLLRESKDYIYYPSIEAQTGRYKALVVNTSDSGIDYVNVIVFNESESLLCYEKQELPSGDTLSDITLSDIKAICDASGINDYLASYVKNFIVTPSDFEDVNESIKLQIYLKAGNSEYESSLLVTSRNKK